VTSIANAEKNIILFITGEGMAISLRIWRRRRRNYI
jgi:hypothetical protein